jgi:hypothetical protein
MASATNRRTRGTPSAALASESIPAAEVVDAPFPPDPRTGSCKINALPRRLRAELDRRIRERDFSSYGALEKWLTAEGYYISRTGIYKYGKRFDRQIAAVRIASEQARIVCRQFKGDEASMQEALMRLVQTEMFNLLAGIAENKLRPRSGAGKRGAGSSLTPVDLGAVARTVGGLVKASIEHQKWVAKLKEKVAAEVAAAAKKIDAVKSEGLSDAAAAKIRDALLEIKV